MLQTIRTTQSSSGRHEMQTLQALCGESFNEKDGNWAEVNLEKKEADVRMKTKLTDREIRDIVSKAGYVLRNIEWKQA